MKCNFENLKGVFIKGKYIIFFIIIFCQIFIYSRENFLRYENSDKQLGNYLAIKGGDTPGYLNIMEVLKETSEYPVYEKDGKIYVGRGPYYGSLYYVLLFITEKEIAVDIIAFLQILLWSLAIIAIINITERFLHYKWLIYIQLIFILSLKYQIALSTFIITDAFSFAFISFFCWWYVKYVYSNKTIYLFISGIFIGLVCVMKPYFFPVYAMLFATYLYHNRITLVSFIKFPLTIGLFVVIIATPFTIHNYTKYKIFAPVQNSSFAGLPPNPALLSIRELVKIFGENSIAWDNSSLMNYFYNKDGKIDNSIEFPKNHIVDGYTLHDIEILRDSVLKATSPETTESIQNFVVQETDRISTIYFNEKPYRKYVYRIESFLNYSLFSYEWYNIDNKMSSRELIRFIYRNYIVILYYFVLIFGLLGFIIYRKIKEIQVLHIIIIWHILLFGFYMGFPESRMMLSPFYLILVFCFLFVDSIILRIKKNNRANKDTITNI